MHQTPPESEEPENLGRVIATQDTVLLGRRTYDEWAGFWPASDIEPFASFIKARTGVCGAQRVAVLRQRKKH